MLLLLYEFTHFYTALKPLNLIQFSNFFLSPASFFCVFFDMKKSCVQTKFSEFAFRLKIYVLHSCFYVNIFSHFYQRLSSYFYKNRLLAGWYFYLFFMIEMSNVGAFYVQPPHKCCKYKSELMSSSL